MPGYKARKNEAGVGSQVCDAITWLPTTTINCKILNSISIWNHVQVNFTSVLSFLNLCVCVTGNVKLKLFMANT